MWQDYVPIALAVGIPSVAAALGIVRYFWNKEKCFTALKNKIDELSKSDGHSSETHGNFHARLKVLEDDAIEIKLYLRQILQKLDIPHK